MLKEATDGKSKSTLPSSQFISVIGKNDHAQISVQVTISYTKTDEHPKAVALKLTIKVDSYTELVYQISVDNWTYTSSHLFDKLYLVWEYFPDKLHEIKIEDEIFRCSGRCESGLFVNGMPSRAIHLVRLCGSIPAVKQFSNATVYEVNSMRARPSIFS
jgi:hypothetical protein